MFHQHFQRHRQPLPTTPMLFIIALLSSILLSSPSLHSIVASPSIFVEATNVQWVGNKNVSPEHKDAHNAPRSQKYWDENGIERPDYAKSDAELSAERRQKNGGKGDGGFGLFGIFLIASGIVVMGAVAYANITGDWDTVLNNPVGSFVADCIKRIMEFAGAKGHKLGSSSTTSTSKVGSDEDAKRLARLARFDVNPKNMLDDMKSD